MRKFVAYRLPFWVIAIGVLFLPDIVVSTGRTFSFATVSMFFIAAILGDAIGYWRKTRELDKIKR